MITNRGSHKPLPEWSSVFRETTPGVVSSLAALLVFVIAAAAPLAASGQTAALDAGLMPPDKAVDTWVKSGAPKVFTQADLYGRIDGGAEVFLEIGFQQLLVQAYKADPASPMIEAEIYRMTDATAARGIYLAKCGVEKRDASFKERHTVNRYQLMFQRDRYFVIVTNASGKESLQPALVKFGAALALKMPPDGGVPALALLDVTDMVPGSRRLMRGAFGLQAIYTLGDGDVLQLGGKLTAAAADYKNAAHGTFTTIVASYPTIAAAAAAFKNVKAKLDSYLKPTKQTDSRLVFVDFEKKFGSVQLTQSRIEIVVHLASEPKS